MLEEKAVIVTNTINAQNQTISSLEIIRQSACGLCGQTRGCGNSMWGKLFAHSNTLVQAENHINAQVGDFVIISIDEQAVLRTALFFYGIPLAVMLLATILVTWASTSAGWQMLAALLGLLLGFLWVKGHAAGQAARASAPKILRFADENTQEKTIEFIRN